jgi:predicted ester cyclase
MQQEGPRTADRSLARASGIEQYERVDSREPKDVIDELFRRVVARDDAVVDELVAEDLVNHAAGGEDDLRGPQGREGWKQILALIVNDLGEEITVDHHHLIAEGEFVVDHMTMRGRHQASTMPLLAGTEVTGAPVAWTYIHIWRVVDGIVVEHWACRDDVGLLRQVGAWPPRRTP